MTSIFQNIETNLELDNIFPYVPWAVSFDTANINSNQVAGQSQKCNELWFFVQDEEKTTQIVKEMTNYVQGIQTQEDMSNKIDVENDITSNTTKQKNSTNTTKNTNTTKSKNKTTKTTNSTKSKSTKK